MKMLKELLKPPFIVECNMRVKNKTEELQFTMTAENHNTYTSLNYFAAEALNEKYERDFAEPMKWKLIEDYDDGIQVLACERCNVEITFEADNVPRNFCPNCGQKLEPAEKK